MHKLTISVLLILLTCSISAQDNIRILTQPTWPQGEFVPVVIEIENPDAGGFARFHQDLPQGFTVKRGTAQGADFYWDNNQVNFVWVKLPYHKKIRISYFAKADESLSGSFRLAGRLDYVISGKERRTADAMPLLIELDRDAVVEADTIIPAVDEVREVKKEEPDDIKNESTNEVRFRVQVAISSERITKEELEGRINCPLRFSITVLRTGNMFKYQSGSFGLYGEASEYLNELKQKGVEDAFIVAFKGDEQISVNLARTLTE